MEKKLPIDITEKSSHLTFTPMHREQVLETKKKKRIAFQLNKRLEVVPVSDSSLGLWFQETRRD